MREASHPSTDILDLNIRWKLSPHEPRQAEADKLGAQTHFAQATGLLRLSGAIGQLLLDSPVWWFEPAQSQLRRQIIHHSCTVKKSTGSTTATYSLFSKLDGNNHLHRDKFVGLL
jgi:hypothetical protein